MRTSDSPERGFEQEESQDGSSLCLRTGSQGRAGTGAVECAGLLAPWKLRAGGFPTETGVHCPLGNADVALCVLASRCASACQAAFDSTLR